MTPTPPLPEDADVAAVREALTDLWAITPTLEPQTEDQQIHREANAALDRLTARVQQAERERDGANAQVIGLIRDCDAAEAREAVLREALAEAHEYQCGCDMPGRLDFCVAKPTSIFRVLAAPDPASARAALATDPGATE